MDAKKLTNMEKLKRRSFFKKLFGAVTAGVVFPAAAKAEAAAEQWKSLEPAVNPTPANRMAGIEPFLAEIGIVSFEFAPRGWSKCNGQLLPINSNQALFSLLGDAYGGDARVNFALPNLQGRSFIHMGSSYTRGYSGGSTAVTLNINHLPQHTHNFGSVSYGTSDSPVNMVPARNASGLPSYGSGSFPMKGDSSFTNVGGSQPHYNMPPYLVLNFIIATQGIFPSQT